MPCVLQLIREDTLTGNSFNHRYSLTGEATRQCTQTLLVWYLASPLSTYWKAIRSVNIEPLKSHSDRTERLLLIRENTLPGNSFNHGYSLMCRLQDKQAQIVPVWDLMYCSHLTVWDLASPMSTCWKAGTNRSKSKGICISVGHFLT